MMSGLSSACAKGSPARAVSFSGSRTAIHASKVQHVAGVVRASKGTEAPQAAASRRQLHAMLLSGAFALANAEGAFAFSTSEKVFVAGSTGATGSKIVAALRAKGIPVVAGVRDPAKATAAGYNKDSGITVVVADVTRSPEELAKLMQGCGAIICATGGGAVTPFDKRAKKVDNQGTKNLVDAAKMAGVGSFVLVSSLLTNAKAVGQGSNPNYVVLQLFGGVLEEKLQAEKYLRASGLRWTIVRPGGLSNDPPSTTGNIVTGREDTFLGLDDPGREISRTSVAQVCAEALLQDGAANKVVEIVANPEAPALSPEAWFANI